MEKEKQLTILTMVIDKIETSADIIKLKSWLFEHKDNLLATERQQLIDAVDGFPLRCRDLSGEDYYTETFKTQ